MNQPSSHILDNNQRYSISVPRISMEAAVKQEIRRQSQS